MDDIYLDVCNLISETLNLEMENITKDCNLSDLSRDSIQLFELLIAFEKKYNFNVSYEDVVRFNTVEDIVNFIHKIKV